MIEAHPNDLKKPSNWLFIIVAVVPIYFASYFGQLTISQFSENQRELKNQINDLRAENKELRREIQELKTIMVAFTKKECR